MPTDRHALCVVWAPGMWTITAEQAVDVWRGLIDAKAAGTARHLGVSNLDMPTIQKLEQETGERPAVMRLESHLALPSSLLSLTLPSSSLP